MPVADYGTYCRMLDRALAGKFAYPAVNVTSLDGRAGRGLFVGLLVQVVRSGAR